MVEKQVREPQQPDLMMYEYPLQFSRFYITWRYFPELSKPSDSVFYYARFAADPDSVNVSLLKWMPVMNYEQAADGYKVLILRTPPQDGKAPK